MVACESSLGPVDTSQEIRLCTDAVSRTLAMGDSLSWNFCQTRFGNTFQEGS